MLSDEARQIRRGLADTRRKTVVWRTSLCGKKMASMTAGPRPKALFCSTQANGGAARPGS